MWTELIKFIGGSTVLLVIIAWLIKSLTNQLLAKDIEKYKFDLRKEADKELAATKAAFNIEALSHQIRFSKLHKRRTDIIEKLYNKIILLEHSGGCLEGEFFLNKFNDNYTEIKGTAERVLDNYFDVHTFINNNKIYFSEELSDNINAFNQLYFDLSIDACYKSKSDKVEQFIKSFQEKSVQFNSQTENIKKIIESDFRKILGVMG